MNPPQLLIEMWLAGPEGLVISAAQQLLYRLKEKWKEWRKCMRTQIAVFLLKKDVITAISSEFNN